jgi:hypothetical protein
LKALCHPHLSEPLIINLWALRDEIRFYYRGS